MISRRKSSLRPWEMSICFSPDPFSLAEQQLLLAGGRVPDPHQTRPHGPQGGDLDGVRGDVLALDLPGDGRPCGPRRFGFPLPPGRKGNGRPPPCFLTRRDNVRPETRHSLAVAARHSVWSRKVAVTVWPAVSTCGRCAWPLL